jgi:hypothetical protein
MKGSILTRWPRTHVHASSSGRMPSLPPSPSRRLRVLGAVMLIRFAVLFHRILFAFTLFSDHWCRIGGSPLEQEELWLPKGSMIEAVGDHLVLLDCAGSACWMMFRMTALKSAPMPMLNRVCVCAWGRSRGGVSGVLTRLYASCTHCYRTTGRRSAVGARTNDVSAAVRARASFVHVRNVGAVVAVPRVIRAHQRRSDQAYFDL